MRLGRISLLLGFALLSASMGYSQGPAFEWVISAGAATAFSGGYSIGHDDLGNVYVTGRFTGTVDFDPGAGTANLTSAGGLDTYITKVDAGGNLVWAKRVGGPNDVYSFDVAVDEAGNVYITGAFSGTADFDPGPGTFNLSSIGLFFDEIFVLKLDVNGDLVWARKMGSSDFDFGRSIAVSASGNVFTTGSFRGTVDFDPGPGTSFLTSAAGGNDIFISKLNASGDFVWAKRLGGTSSDIGYAVTVDDAENVFTTGSFSTTADFDPGASVFNLTEVSNGDIFISKLDEAGNFVWAKGMGGTSSDVGYGVQVDDSGNVYTTGFFHTTVDFDPGAGTANLVSVGFNDAFISKLDANGNYLWAKGMGGTSDDESSSLALDAYGNVYATGGFESTVDFDPGPGSFNLTPGGSGSGFIVKLDEAGDFVWAQAFEGLGRTTPEGIDVDIDGSIYTTGYFNGTVDFDTGPGVSNVTASGSNNTFIHKMHEATPPTITSFAPTSGPIGTTVTITGTNFSTTPANNIVFFGGVKATASSASATELTVVVPAGAQYGSITVINLSVGLQAVSAQPFIPTFPEGGRIIPASFEPKFEINLTAGNNVNGMAMADLDGDGWNDVLAVEHALPAVSIFRNLGLGGNLTAASFAPKISIGGAGNQPALYTEDLDGDGKLDIITGFADVSAMYFATFRNISTPGNLAFEPVELWAGLVYSGTVANVVDVDGDGLSDLIAQHGNGSVNPDFWIAKNQSTPGNIQFGASVSYFGGVTLDAGAGVTAADLDNDGKPEMIVKHNFGGSFSIINNTSSPGSISFGTPFSIPQSIYGGIQVADFNQDGKNDLAWKQGFSNDDVHIRINTNSGGALAATDFATEVILNSELNNYGGISLTDVNGDGKVDIMATDGADFGVFENIFTGGAFSANSFVRAYKRPGGIAYVTSIVAGDLNGDTKPDLVFATISPGSIYIVENKNVHSPVISLTTVTPLAGAVGSTVTITGDYFSTTTTDNLVQFGTVKATVLTATKTQLTVTVPAGAQYAPVSVTRDRLTTTYHLPFNVTFSAGTTFDASSFATPVNFTLTGAYYEVMTGDLNSDGKPDVVATGGSFDAYAFRNTHSSGSISTSSLLADDTLDAYGFNHLPSLQDFDGDGKTDLIVHEGYFYQNLSTPSEIDFINGTSFEFYSLNHSFGDFDHDGKTDFVGTRFSESKIIVTTNKTTTGPFVFFNGIQADFASFDIGVMSVSFTKPAVFGYTATADFDNDGWADIVATNSDTDNFTVWKNNGANRISTASFTNTGDFTTGDNPARIYAGDLDVDGKVDLMMYYGAGTSSGIITVFHNTSTGSISFTRQDFTIGAGSNGGASAIGDLDGDGKPEIVVPSEAANVFRIFKNNTTPGVINATSFVASPTYAVTAPRAVAIGDINLDGKPEIIVTSAPNSLLVFENLVPTVSITFTTQPSDEEVCSGTNATFTLIATGDTNLQYQWQIDNAGFVDLTNNSTYSGVTTATLTITNPTVSLDGSVYRCVVRGDNSTDTPSALATLTVNSIPTIPTIGTTNLGCGPASTTLNPTGASAGEEYKFYDVATGGSPLASGPSFTTPSLTISTTYHISTFNTTTLCESARVPAVVNVQFCNPPVVEATTATAFIDGVITIDLENLISDEDDNLDASTLQILSQPMSGAPASLNGFILTVDYTGIPFQEADNVEIEICDLTGICTQQVLTIELNGEIEVFNAISPNSDTQNDFLLIEFIELFPDTQKNRVTIYNRWGDIVWEGTDYDNSSVVFDGTSNNGKDLPSGTYFYKIEFTGGRESKTGFLSLKR